MLISEERLRNALLKRYHKLLEITPLAFEELISTVYSLSKLGFDFDYETKFGWCDTYMWYLSNWPTFVLEKLVTAYSMNEEQLCELARTLHYHTHYEEPFWYEYLKLLVSPLGAKRELVEKCILKKRSN